MDHFRVKYLLTNQAESVNIEFHKSFEMYYKKVMADGLLLYGLTIGMF